MKYKWNFYLSNDLFDMIRMGVFELDFKWKRCWVIGLIIIYVMVVVGMGIFFVYWFIRYWLWEDNYLFGYFDIFGGLYK